MTVAPTASIASRIPVTLWAGRLSITTRPQARLQYLFHIRFKGQCIEPGKVISPTSPRSAIAPISVRVATALVWSVMRPSAFQCASIASCHCQITACFIDKHQILQIHGSISCQYCTRSCCSFRIPFSCMQSFFSW